jgi:hypothetical protein
VYRQPHTGDDTGVGKDIVAKRSSDAPPRRTGSALPVDLKDSVELTGALIELAEDAGLREGLASRVRAMDFGANSRSRL